MAENSLGSRLVFTNQNTTNGQTVTALAHNTSQESHDRVFAQAATTRSCSKLPELNKLKHVGRIGTTSTTKIFPWMSLSRNKLKTTGNSSFIDIFSTFYLFVTAANVHIYSARTYFATTRSTIHF